MVNHNHHNATVIQAELDWLQSILKARSAMNSNSDNNIREVLEIPPPSIPENASSYANLVQKLGLNESERFLLILAAVPHIKPQLLDMFMGKNQLTQQIYTEFGGRKGKNHNGFIPTGETVLFILAGSDLAKRFKYLSFLSSETTLFKEGHLKLSETDADDPYLNGTLIISRDTLQEITSGKVRKPDFSADFPAQLLETEMTWDDLVLNPHTADELQEIEIWLKHKDKLLQEWGMHRKLKPGFKALFYGPPGTGKTLTTTLLGQKLGLDVYRIDLSRMVSKYIGETEKNLAKIFDRAERKGWILFFDEADALFGKRTSVSDAHDRYANQEVSYLLQRIEDYDGLVILATNLKNNLDEAFMRRFQASVFFPMPQPEERKMLWKKGFPSNVLLEDRINLQELAKSYELSGGSIIQVIQHSLLMALDKERTTIHLGDIREGIRREYHKMGRTI
ncbi:ATP-binding protein [Algoriphagus persicinus]|uniref:ATP-binding protein n=1 Tax=Algoriphagus persicinus TaxID=3108754 RepID=UPI002B3F2AFE|nr:ATP-binding protein [Algoriphagus sp. E1-3-M2]MEB2783084.1 ATP-binding protein [Algoriphagus sp. E1-3-M2]